MRIETDSPLGHSRRLLIPGAEMETLKQVLVGLYVAFGEAAGGDPALRLMGEVIRDAIEDGAIDDPVAIRILEAVADHHAPSAPPTPQCLLWVHKLGAAVCALTDPATTQHSVAAVADGSGLV